MSPESEPRGMLLTDVRHIKASLGQARRHKGPRWPSHITESVAGLTMAAVTRIHLALPLATVIIRSRRTSTMLCRAYGRTGVIR